MNIFFSGADKAICWCRPEGSHRWASAWVHALRPAPLPSWGGEVALPNMLLWYFLVHEIPQIYHSPHGLLRGLQSCKWMTCLQGCNHCFNEKYKEGNIKLYSQIYLSRLHGMGRVQNKRPASENTYERENEIFCTFSPPKDAPSFVVLWNWKEIGDWSRRLFGVYIGINWVCIYLCQYTPNINFGKN